MPYTHPETGLLKKQPCFRTFGLSCGRAATDLKDDMASGSLRLVGRTPPPQAVPPLRRGGNGSFKSPFFYDKIKEKSR